jgi:hypothetical protein
MLVEDNSNSKSEKVPTKDSNYDVNKEIINFRNEMQGKLEKAWETAPEFRKVKNLRTFEIQRKYPESTMLLPPNDSHLYKVLLDETESFLEDKLPLSEEKAPNRKVDFREELDHEFDHLEEIWRNENLEFLGLGIQFVKHGNRKLVKTFIRCRGKGLIPALRVTSAPKELSSADINIIYQEMAGRNKGIKGYLHLNKELIKNEELMDFFITELTPKIIRQFLRRARGLISLKD